MYPPNTVVSPRNRISQVDVISDGTTNGNEFSLARLTLHNGDVRLGIRWDFSEWSKDPDMGYPVIRGQYPCWFILPRPIDLRNLLNSIDLNDLTED